jgi:hypothetical protein
MNAKNLLIVSLLVLLVLSGCSRQEGSRIDGTSVVSSDNVKMDIDRLEIYHFHGNNQCYSCKTVGAYAEETVNTYFADELKSGKIVFAHINAQLPENEELAKKYGVTGSSLWLGVYNKDGFHAEQNVNVWYKIDDKEDYMYYLKVVIEKRLAGDLN